MSGNWKDRIDGIKRIVLALGVMSLCIVMSLHYKAQAEPDAPNIVSTRNAQYEKCSAAERESRLGLFGCAVVLKPKVKTSSIRFLSSEAGGSDARSQNRPFFKAPGKP
ncbi:hypothetical protein EGN72_13815 [Pseudorhodobacter sp. E13]|uniref:hypothetical protein n=1 Tax=Pseudorhodobacter sp. E13 TaxID=2487931 RepID=UPI000F8DAE15|nr:hypothetical protein [Pseudorhodobacter sp. E13]RUS59764.1 hypothetical protein EGN72_13815 [Pseudorhodobacter sp. E13]